MLGTVLSSCTVLLEAPDCVVVELMRWLVVVPEVSPEVSGLEVEKDVVVVVVVDAMLLKLDDSEVEELLLCSSGIVV